MKKMNDFVKILSKKEAELVKGGGWMHNNKGLGWGCKKQSNNDCPPPDPTGE